MKVTRGKIDKQLETLLASYVTNPKTAQAIMKLAFQKYSLPFFRTLTILNLDASMEELNDLEIFWILDCLRETIPKANIDLTKWFTEIEIKEYGRAKYKENVVEFPLILPMIQVTDTQWIGKIMASELIVWRGSILRYNKNIQRRIRTIVNKNVTYGQITVFHKAISSIVGLLNSKRFIPNAITLNIGEDEIDFYYDEVEKNLVINKLDHFDLVDGYHRLIALSKAKEADPNFDYPMELRITNFSEDVADQLIWQEEQRNIMPKTAIESYNMDDTANKITRRINENTACNFSGAITRGGLIDASVFSDAINECFLTGMTEEEKRVSLARIPKDVIQSLNLLTEADSSLLTKRFTVLEIRLLVYCCYKFYEKDKNNIYDFYSKLQERKLTERVRKALSSAKRKNTLKLLDEEK